jgi:hypothetical protein
MRKLLTILFLFPLMVFSQTVNVKVFSTHYGNGNTSQYSNYANSSSDMDKMTNTAYAATTLYWSGTMAASTCLNWGGWTTMYYAGAGIPNNGEYFSVEVSGYFTAVETGYYYFCVNSDDGGDVLVNNTLVATYYGGHGMSGCQSGGAIYLTAGTAYPFKARMQEYGGGEGLAVQWRRPSQGSFSLQPAELGAATPTYLTGTVSVPTLTSYPSLSLYKVVSNVETFIETKTVASNGTYSFTLPLQNTTYRIYPSLTVQGLTTADFNLCFGEVQNVNTPNNVASGLVMTGTKQWKAADFNKNGKLDLGDAFLILAHITGLKPSTQVLWFNPTDYDGITKDNFSTVNPVTYFTINVTTSNVTQNIKYCILGDVNLSHSSQ